MECFRRIYIVGGLFIGSMFTLFFGMMYWHRSSLEYANGNHFDAEAGINYDTEGRDVSMYLFFLSLSFLIVWSIGTYFYFKKYVKIGVK